MIHFLQADAARLPFADKSVDFVFGSPPYQCARSYGIGAQRKCAAWIDWMLDVTTEAVRVSRGLVVWICAGVTRKWCYQPGPEGLLYEWWKRGGQCWRPAYWHRVGIPGSGGKQWVRADVEYALCFTGCRGTVPWADNTANGHPPKWAPGGEMSYRLADGTRTNQWGHHIRLDGQCTGGDTETEPGVKAADERQPSHQVKTMRRSPNGHRNGDMIQEDSYEPPVLANPGSLIQGIPVGGGLMGSDYAHENEAPFPQRLAEWFIRSWCPPGGITLDPFSGSGTTVAAAVKLGRRGIGSDLRLNQCVLGRKRCAEVQTDLFT